MGMKKLKLSKQYFLNMLIFLFILAAFIVSREGSIPQEYKKIFMWIYYIAMVICGFSGFSKNELVDELAEKVLSKVNHIIWIIIRIGLLILAVIVGAPKFKEINLTRDTICLLILSFLFVVTFLKYILFIYYDRKGF
jgi:hypothetical protein